MKPIIYSLLIASIFVLSISCELEYLNNFNEKGKDKKNQTQLVTGHLKGNSICKNNLMRGDTTVVTPDSLSHVEYSFDNEKKVLTFKHINAGFNCCPDSLYCKAELKGDTIIIQEYEQGGLCKCNCLYDLEIDVNGVDMKAYQIKFIEPYAKEQDKLIFGIDLTTDSTGSYHVTRKRYPWGINSLSK